MAHPGAVYSVQGALEVEPPHRRNLDHAIIYPSCRGCLRPKTFLIPLAPYPTWSVATHTLIRSVIVSKEVIVVAYITTVAYSVYQETFVLNTRPPLRPMIPILTVSKMLHINIISFYVNL